MSAIIRFLLFLFRKTRPFLFRPTCRFYPSCSYYAEEAIEKFGFGYGCFLAFKRLIRCNQWFPGGYDPVPVGKSDFGKRTPKINVSRGTLVR